MNGYPKSFKLLLECFQKLPSIGEKTAERMVFAVLAMPEEQVEEFSSSIVNVKKNINKCDVCNNLCEDILCEICKNKEQRDQQIICVLEDTKNVILFEKMKVFNGMYHVIENLISPLDGKNPGDIDFTKLINRIEKEKIKELIIALKPTIEGQTTMLYISKLLKDKNIIITKLATGVPIGTDMEYLDALTLEMAIEDRKNVS